MWNLVKNNKELRMKNQIHLLLGAVLLMGSVSACHKESDVLLAYAFEDDLSFKEAKESFAGKYLVFWKAMNTNYLLWDYEKACGLDWDEHKKTFLPRFEALDEDSIKVSDATLKALMTEMVAPLHDGHLYVEFENHTTNEFVAVSPGNIRYKARDSFNEADGFVPTLRAYEQGEQLAEHREENSILKNQIQHACNTDGIGYRWALNRIEELKAKTSLTEVESKELEGLQDFVKEMKELTDADYSVKKMAEVYNGIALRYAYLNIPEMVIVNQAFAEVGINVKYALFNDGIAYFYLSNFNLTPYLHKKYSEEYFPNADELTQGIIDRGKEVWQAWFDTIQKRHKEGTLKGVIIDVRSNGGGIMLDSNFLFGCLLPKGGIQYGWSRFKRGVGRYDYSPMMPMVSFTMDAEHEIVDDVPVVILTNARSVSMSEMTSLTSKQMANARQIGRRTYGGLCGLTGNESFADNYSGHIGVDGKTPVYCYVPSVAIFNMDKQALDGIGVEPDIEVGLDLEAFKATGRDTQLDRALEYIRTGK